MKKIIATCLTLIATSVMAADADLSYVRDHNSDKDGVRLTLTGDPLVLGVSPVASVTHVGDAYTRYAVGGSLNLGQVGPFTFNAVGTGVFQDTKAAVNGWGGTAGLNIGYSFSKNTSLNAGIEHLWAQDKISGSEGNLVTVGVKMKL